MSLGESKKAYRENLFWTTVLHFEFYIYQQTKYAKLPLYYIFFHSDFLSTNAASILP